MKLNAKLASVVALICSALAAAQIRRGRIESHFFKTSHHGCQAGARNRYHFAPQGDQK
jgi:hypothetical protein